MDKLYKEKFDMSQFKDTFATRLAQAIKAQQKGKVIEIEEKKPAAAAQPSLMEALKASLGKYEKVKARPTRVKRVPEQPAAERTSRRAR